MSAPEAPGAGARDGVVRGRRDDDARRSRFHTARGPMPLSAWVRLPAARLRARFGRIPERPWIVPAAIGLLGRRIERNWTVVELGAGRSTAWLARRAGQVVSYEDNEHWAGRTRAQLARAGLGNVDLRERPVEHFAAELARFEDGSLDLLIVDFLESPAANRLEAVRAGRTKVRPAGYLLLDDSDRPAYAEADELLSGWRRRRFVGVKDEWPTVAETTIFRRPPTL